MAGGAGAQRDRVRLSGSRPGPVTAATTKAIAAIKAERELSPAGEVAAAMADRTARICDAAYRADDPRLQLAAGQRLASLLASLSPTPPPTHGGADDGDHAAGALDRELSELLAGGPVPVRDSADT